MKRLFVFNFICFVFIADYNHCKNDEASERKLLKLKKIKSMAEKPVKTTAKTSLMERYSNTEKAVNLTVNNPLWSMQWHLHKDQYPSMGVYEAWEMGYTGKGVVVALVGDGLDTDQYDLVGNFKPSLSYDFVDDEYDVSYDAPNDDHSTRSAGIIAAAKNDHCVTGIAYDVSFAVIRVLTKLFGVTDARLANAWTYKLNEIDIRSHGIGIGVDQGGGFYPLEQLPRSALVKSVTEGRHGKGAIFIFGSGNDGELLDDCNTVEQVNSIYTISVSPLAPDGGPAVYAEECACVITAAYAGEDYYNGTKKYLATTYINDTCIDNYGGGAAASSVATGVIALALQANPDLTWRDVQHLLAETSISTDIPRGNFYTNAVGKNVSYGLGFGMMNAKGLVQKATKWKGVPSKMTCNSGRIQVNKCCTRNVNSTYFVDDCPIQHLEHVQIYVSCEAYWREHTEIHIVSPQGTDTRILRQRKQDYATGRFSWTFMSVHTWGENPKGDWTVRLEDFLNCDNEMTLYSWELILHGTVTDPADGTPKDGILGGHCDKNIQCGDGTNCLLIYNICVNCTIAEHRVINNMCVKDGYDYCNTDIPCQVENAWCNADNTCETCSDGYHAIDGFCKQDGLLGAYCDGLTVCVDPGAWCEPDTDRCLLCPSGYRILEGVCEKDGAVYGYCDAHIPCDTTKTPYLACDPVTSMCINCRQTRQHRIINGFCMKDGAIGGFCSQEISCTKSGSSCDAEFDTCISCTMAGYRSVNGYCLQDGVFGGYCDTVVNCTDGTGCGSESHVCVNCSSNGYRVLPDGFCRQDGLIGGYCDANISCLTFSGACDPATSLCSTCYAGHSIINGYCYKDDLVKADIDWDIESIIGTSVAGFIIGVCINGVIFIHTLQKALVTKAEFASKET